MTLEEYTPYIEAMHDLDDAWGLADEPSREFAVWHVRKRLAQIRSDFHGATPLDPAEAQVELVKAQVAREKAKRYDDTVWANYEGLPEPVEIPDDLTDIVATFEAFEADARRAQPGRDAASDPVFRPAHYARFIIEPATFITANNLPFLVGNVVKYVTRYDAKDGREGLLKARRCVDMLIEAWDRKARIEAGEAPSDVWKDVL